MQIENLDAVKEVLRITNAYEYTNVYKPALAQLHADYNSNDMDNVKATFASLNIAIRMRIKRLISAIGAENFAAVGANDVFATFDNIYKDIKSEKYTIPNLMPAEESKKIHDSVYISDDKVVEKPSEMERVKPVNTSVEALPEEEKNRLTEIEDKLKYFKNEAQYPSWRSQEIVVLIYQIENFLKHTINNIIGKGSDPSEQFEVMEDWILEINSYLDEKAPPDGYDDKDAPKSKDKKKTKAIAVSKRKTVLSDTDILTLEESGSGESKLDDASVIKELPFMGEAGEFIYFDESNIPRIHETGINEVYIKLSSVLRSISSQALRLAEQNENVATQFKTQFNGVFHAIKAKDIVTKDFITLNEEKIREGLGSAFEFNKFKRELYKNYLSTKLVNDSELYNDIYWALAYCVNYTLYGHITGSVFIKYKTESGVQLDEAALDKIKNKYLESASSAVSTKLFSALDINNYANFKRTRNNTIAEISISTAILLKNSIRSISGKGDSVQVQKSLCPVCFKSIRWFRPEDHKENEAYSDFEVQNVLPFNIETRQLLTDNVMSKGGPYAPPNGLIGKKSWQDIKNLLSSEGVSGHREGWLRRAAALQQMGGYVSGDIKINKTMFRCPYPSANKSCGISLNPLVESESLLPPKPDKLSSTNDVITYIESIISTSKEYLDMPTWRYASDLFENMDENIKKDRRDLKRGLMVIRGSLPEAIEYEGLAQPGWNSSNLLGTNGSDKDRIAQADPKIRGRLKQSISGGYKFSKSIFRCPCKITKDMMKGFKDGGGDNLSKTHYTYAMPYYGIYNKSEMTNVSLPTNKNGKLSEVQDGAFGYLICGAQTSLSSFDRSLNDDSAFIGMMKDIYSDNPNMFISLLDYFLKEGVDVGDIMSIFPYMSGTQQKEIVSTSEVRRIRDRINKLSELISHGMARKSDELFDKLSEFMLVCPFGHKFKIGDSLKFGAAHSSVSLKNEKMLEYMDMVNESANSFDFLLSKGDIFKIESDTQRRYAYHNDWIVFEPKNRLINTFSIKGKLSQLSPEMYLKFLDDTVFLKFKGPDGDDYAFKDTLRISKQAWSGIGNSMPVIDGADFIGGGSVEVSADIIVDGMNIDIRDQSTAKEYAEAAFQIDNGQVSPIPGSIDVEEAEDFESFVDAKRESLGRAIKSALNVIAVWNENILNEEMAQIFVIPVKEDVDIGSVAKSALSAVMNIDLSRPVDNYVENNWSGLKSIINENIETFGTIKPNETSRDISIQIISDALIRFVLTDEGGREIIPNSARKFENRLKREAPAIAESIIANNSRLVSHISSTLEVNKKFTSTQLQTRQINKLFLLSVSSYLASSLSQIYKDYFDSRSERYIMYDIGVDLSDYKNIMRNASSMMTDVYELAHTELEDYSVFGSIDNPLTENIDKAFKRLVYSIQWTNRLALSPVNIDNAKKYASERMAEIGGQDAKWFAEQIDAFFPVATMPLKHDHTKIWIGGAKIPVTGREGYQITDMPDTISVGSRVVNTTINFDSSKMQIGQIAPKPTKVNDEYIDWWAPSVQGYGGGGFVGLTIPIIKGSAQNTTTGSAELKVLDYNVAIDIGGKPVNISFLFQRGFTNEDNIELLRIESLLEEAEQNFGLAIQRLTFELDGEELDIQIEKLKDAHTDRMSELRGRRTSIPLRYRTDTSSFLYDTRHVSGSMPFITEEQFVKQFASSKEGSKNVYNNYPQHRKSEVSNKIPIVLNLYKKLRTTQDSTISDQIIEHISKLADYQNEIDSSELNLMLTDPINAYRLINSQTLSGMNLDESDRDVLVNFIMDVYGVWRVLDVAERVRKEGFLGDDRKFKNPVTAHEILTMTDPISNQPWPPIAIKKLNIYLKDGDFGDNIGWANHTGTFYDVYQSGDDNDVSDDFGKSYIQYVYNIFNDKNYAKLNIRPTKDGVPSMYNLREVRRVGGEFGMTAVRREQTRGRPAKQDDPSVVARKVANLAATSVTRFITASARGANEYSPKIRNNEIIDKISKRRISMSGIMIDSRIKKLLPDAIINEAMLEIMYDDMM